MSRKELNVGDKVRHFNTAADALYGEVVDKYWGSRVNSNNNTEWYYDVKWTSQDFGTMHGYTRNELRRDKRKERRPVFEFAVGQRVRRANGLGSLGTVKSQERYRSGKPGYRVKWDNVPQNIGFLYPEASLAAPDLKMGTLTIDGVDFTPYVSDVTFTRTDGNEVDVLDDKVDVHRDKSTQEIQIDFLNARITNQRKQLRELNRAVKDRNADIERMGYLVLQNRNERQQLKLELQKADQALVQQHVSYTNLVSTNAEQRRATPSNAELNDLQTRKEEVSWWKKMFRK